MMHRTGSRLAPAFVLAMAACSSSGQSGDGATDARAGGDAVSVTDGTSPRDGSSQDSGSTSSSGTFRIGMNAGYYGPQFTDEQTVAMGMQAGASSARPSLPESFLVQWGYNIRVGTFMTNAAAGLGHVVAFLTSPTAAHSSAPAGTSADQVPLWAPTHLYEPVTLSDGTINPNNYWAAYVYQTVQAYGAYVDIWEIWNEPDWTSDWNATQTWMTSPPTAAQLTRFNADIFTYIRMLRVSRQAARLANPNARIAVGGLGYPGFLAAILRYTDNPGSGTVTSDYPATGGAYFDVMSMHYYPLFGPGPSSDEGVDGFVSLHDQFAAVMTAAGVTGKSWVCTETGASSQSFGGMPGGEPYARDYDVKVMTTAAGMGFESVQWFVLGNGATTSTDPYAWMGWYNDLGSTASVSAATRTDTGEANRTLGHWMLDAQADAAATSTLALPSTVRGGAFHRADGHRMLVLWALTHGTSETASATLPVATSTGFDVYAWDAERSGNHTTVMPSGSTASLALTGEPQIFIER